MLRTLAAVLLLAGPAAAQDPGALLAQTLSPNALKYYWLRDAVDPAQTREAVGVAYTEIVGAAGNVDIALGYYARGGQGLGFVGAVENLYGQEPRNARFLPDHIEVTTTMPGPDDPRCCPTGTAVWSIDRSTLAARRVQ